MRNKIFTLLLALFVTTTHVVAQDTFDKTVDGLTDLVNSFGKLVASFSKIDSSINKGKTKAMVSDLYGKTGDVVTVKKVIVLKLKDSSTTYKDFGDDINLLQKTLTDLMITIDKYGALVAATGIATEKLAFALKQDYWVKVQTLGQAKDKFFSSASFAVAKAKLVEYFEKCIAILEQSQLALTNFKP